MRLKLIKCKFKYNIIFNINKFNVIHKYANYNEYLYTIILKQSRYYQYYINKKFNNNNIWIEKKMNDI